MPNLPDQLSPGSAIKVANRAHPAFKYALVVAGLVAIVVVITRWGISAQTAIFGTIILVVLMVLFLVFAQAASLNRAALSLPAQFLVWSFLLIIIASVVLLFTSTFFNAPLPLKTIILKGKETSTSTSGSSPTVTDTTTTNQASKTNLDHRMPPAPVVEPTASVTIVPKETEETKHKPATADIKQKSGPAPIRSKGDESEPVTLDSEFPYSMYINQMLVSTAMNFHGPKSSVGSAMISFAIRRDGSVRDVKIEKSSGNRSLDEAAMEAVLRSSPLPPLPFGYKGAFLRVHMKFS